MKRDANLDIIRCIALVLVFCRHFLTGSGVYALPVSGVAGFSVMLLQIISLAGVSLFIMLTGYLCCKKELSFRYYLGIIKVFVVYALACLACLVFKAFYMDMPLSLWSFLSGIFNHTACGDYGWYVAMYTGLFLLIPFLNVLFNNLPGQGSKLVLIFTLLYLTAVPLVSNTFVHVYTKWWDNLYPLVYYFIGAYLREYRPKISAKKALCLLVLLLLVYSGMDYWNSSSGMLLWSAHSSYDGFKATSVTLLIFILFLKTDLSRWPVFVKHCIEKLSLLSFNIYLLSFISDTLIYDFLRSNVSSVALRLAFVPLTIAISLVISFAMAVIINYPAKLIEQGIRAPLLKIENKFINKNCS